jgi:hypothetical protein
MALLILLQLGLPLCLAAMAFSVVRSHANVNWVKSVGLKVA